MHKLGDSRLSATNLKKVETHAVRQVQHIDSSIPLDIDDLKETLNLKSKQTIESIAVKGQPNLSFFLEQ
jgi:hypothetical protein